MIFLEYDLFRCPFVGFVVGIDEEEEVVFVDFVFSCYVFKQSCERVGLVVC